MTSDSASYRYQIRTVDQVHIMLIYIVIDSAGALFITLTSHCSTPLLLVNTGEQTDVWDIRVDV